MTTFVHAQPPGADLAISSFEGKLELIRQIIMVGGHVEGLIYFASCNPEIL